ncbi:MAG: hypothetical protein PHT59_07445 [Candidatus Omnitrophica bacterium]|nr:hypothetical protein [Candidatus Omnitrophota bacterium]
MELIQFRPEHLIGIEKKDADSHVMMMLGDLDQRAEEYAKLGPAVTLIEDGRILAVWGVAALWKGVGEFWMLISPEGRGKWKALYEHSNGFLVTCKEKYGFHRIQAAVLQGNNRAHRCAIRFGFIPEGMMINYGPNKEHFVRYARF